MLSCTHCINPPTPIWAQIRGRYSIQMTSLCDPLGSKGGSTDTTVDHPRFYTETAHLTRSAFLISRNTFLNDSLFKKKGKGRQYLEGGLKALPLKVNLGLVSCLGIETLRTNFISLKKLLIQFFTHYNSKFVVRRAKEIRYR